MDIRLQAAWHREAVSQRLQEELRTMEAVRAGFGADKSQYKSAVKQIEGRIKALHSGKSRKQQQAEKWDNMFAVLGARGTRSKG